MGSFADAIIPFIDWPCVMILTDLSHRILRYVKRYFEENSFNPMVKNVYLACDACNLPVRDEALDCVTSFAGYENIVGNTMAGIQESYRVLKAGGSCIYEMAMVDGKR